MDLPGLSAIKNKIVLCVSEAPVPDARLFPPSISFLFFKNTSSLRSVVAFAEVDGAIEELSVAE